MADDLKNRGPGDRTRVNLHQDHEVRYWTEKWGLSREELATTVKKVAASVDAVAREPGRGHA